MTEVITPAPTGGTPAAHAASHEDGGSDELDLTGLAGAGSPSEILSIPTAETDDTLVLAPDGAGGVEFRAEAGGASGIPNLINSVKASPDTPDDEFLTSLAGTWTVVDGSSGTVALRAAAGAGLYDLATRPGWILAQVGTASGDSVQLRQDYTLPDGKCIVCPVSFAFDWAAAPANNEVQIGIGINTDNTGFNAGTHTEIFVDTDAGGARMLVNGDGGAVSPVFATEQYNLNGLHFLRMDRSGLVYQFFWSRDGFSWTYLGARTLGAAADNLWWFAVCGATMANRIVVGSPWFRQGTALAPDPWPL